MSAHAARTVAGEKKQEILPVNYFHVVFTGPHELNTIILNNKKLMFNILFAAASKTLLKFGENELNGTPGFLAILHTWDQKLKAHFHLHCIIAGKTAFISVYLCRFAIGTT